MKINLLLQDLGIIALFVVFVLFPAVSIMGGCFGISAPLDDKCVELMYEREYKCDCLGMVVKYTGYLILLAFLCTVITIFWIAVLIFTERLYERYKDDKKVRKKRR